MTQSTAITATSIGADIERVLIDGDLARLNPEQRVTYYNHTCRSLGLNPLTKPFAYLKLNGQTLLYARKDCTDQLRGIHKVNITIVSAREEAGVYVVTARATMPDGRQDEDVGAVPLPAGGEARCNAMMKAHTKAKRRATLGVVGLGMLDESEIDSIPGAQRVEVTLDGEVIDRNAGAPVRLRAEEGGPSFETFCQDIADADTVGGLKAVGEAIASVNGRIPRADKEKLTSHYAQRLTALKALAAAAVDTSKGREPGED